MAYTEQFIVFGKKAAFDASFSAGEVKATSIVFIEDTKQIWTQGTLYSCPFTAVEIQEFLESKVDKITGKSLVADDLITKLTALKTQTEITSDINAVKTTVDNYTVNGKKISTNPVLAKGDVGLGNVDNTSDANKPVSTAQATAIADAKKAGTDAQAAVEEVAAELADHKADKDKKHIPAGGHERQILAWESDGTAKWDDLANMFTGLEELLAYGVEWKDNVADPHLTRIGNMSLHKTLPIQSQLKGCIAQEDKIIYWLDEDDWRFRKDPTTIAVDLTADTETFAVPSVEGLGINQYVRSMDYIAKITAIDAEASTITVAWELPEVAEGEDPIDLTTITSLEIGSRLDGYDGTVRVYCPNFYIKSQIIGNTRRVWLSTVKIDNTWTYQHEILIDAYRSTVLNTVPENMGYLSTLPVNSAISVVNTATYCRGGGNSSTYDQYLETDPCRTGLGKPRTTGLNRATMRQYAKNAGSYIMSYDQYKNIMYWLYVVEYANFNSQEAFNSALTDEGYHQGGMGPGVTTINGNYWRYYNGYTPLTPCGYLNEIGNGSGIKAMTFVTPTVSGGEPTQSYTVQVPRWRGFDNPFGDIWTNLDGIIIDADADNHPNNMNYVYTCKDPDKFGETLTEDWEKIGEEIHQDGYTKLFDLGDAAHIIPKVMGGNTTTYKCDYHWTGAKNATLRALIVGGGANDGSYAGLGYFYSYAAVSDSGATVGFRSVSRFLSFSSQE